MKRPFYISEARWDKPKITKWSIHWAYFKTWFYLRYSLPLKIKIKNAIRNIKI